MLGQLHDLWYHREALPAEVKQAAGLQVISVGNRNKSPHTILSNSESICG